MKPAQFGYIRATSLEEVFNALTVYGSDAKVIAGGQSLVPMLNFRLVRPGVLVDINRVPGLGFISESGDGGVRIGALTRHHTVETSELVWRRYPVLSAAMKHVAHLAIRNRGTIGGSLSHADPAAELALMSVLLDARIHVASPGGNRVVPAEDFFVAALMTALDEREIVTEVVLPPLPGGMGWGFEETAKRAGDFAIAATGVLLGIESGTITDARVAVMGVGEVPERVSAAERLLVGEPVGGALFERTVHEVRAAVEPSTDLHASAAYRRHLIGVLVHRALNSACRRAEEGCA